MTEKIVTGYEHLLKKHLRVTGNPVNRDRPTGYTTRSAHMPVIFYKNRDWRYPQGKDQFIIVNMYFPKNDPKYVDDGVMMILHKHHHVLECKADLFCHQLGFEPNEAEQSQFDRVWSYLYGLRKRSVQNLLDF